MNKETLLNEAEGYALLQKYGIPVPRHTLTTTPDEAAAAAEAIGFPVVLKIVSPDIIHKSDAGGVVTGITDADMVRQSFAAISAAAHRFHPGCRITGILVEQQLAGNGIELLIGGKRDPAFGPVLTFGIGGVMVELLKDVAMRILPASDAKLSGMIREIRGYPLLTGYRGRAPMDISALEDALTSASRLFLEEPEIVEFDINPFILYEDGGCAVDARFLLAPPGKSPPKEQRTPADVDIFSLSTIALVGASTDPSKLGYAIFRNLLSFEGTIYPVNVKGDELLGHRIYPSLSDLPKRPDAAIIAVSPPHVPSVMEEAGVLGVPLAIIITAGFRETGESGAELEQQISAIAKSHGMRFTGPNALGLMVPRLNLNATFDPKLPRHGHIAFLSQSGAIITTTVDWSLAEEIGLSMVVSVGNQTDLTFEDYLMMAAQDNETRAIILYVEEILNGSQFISHAGKVSETKPIIALKAGKSEIGRQAASSHTGSLAGSYEVYKAAFNQAGIIPAGSLKEAFGVAGLLASEGYPAGNRAVIVSSAGGFAVLSSDYAEEWGIEIITLSDTLRGGLNTFMPPGWSGRNPIDMIGDAGVGRYAKTFDALIRHQDEWDIAFVISVPSTSVDAGDLANEIVRFSRDTHKIVVGCLLGGESMLAGVRILRNAHIPNFGEIRDAFVAVGTALRKKNHDNGSCKEQ